MELKATLEYLYHDGIHHRRTVNIRGTIVWTDFFEKGGFMFTGSKWQKLPDLEDCDEPELEKLYQQMKKEAVNENL